jgi:4-diphosphocytidyl-2-C-methyl-D-erythritol kinase
MVIKKAYAKVNLFLNVLDKRDDGYHDLEMFNAKIDLYDTLEFRKIDNKDMVIIRSNDLFLSNQDNIVIQVARYLLREYGVKSGLEITIDKKIPFGAGLAGNSADSAAVIKGINELFNLGLSLKTMQEIGLVYGADIPYCLVDSKAFVTGIGEVVTEVEFDFENSQVLLINPKEYISTKEVFELADKKECGKRCLDIIKANIKQNDLVGLKKCVFNSLEDVVLNNYPNILEMRNIIVSNLDDFGLVMTGSGSSFVKIVDKEDPKVKKFISEQKNRYIIKLYNFL